MNIERQSVVSNAAVAINSDESKDHAPPEASLYSSGRLTRAVPSPISIL